MLHRYLRNRRGFTLIEVITAMALLSLVTLMVFSFFSYGNAAFTQGKRQNEAQAELRIVNDYIVQEMRFATWASLSSTHPGTIDVTNVHDYIYLDGDRIVHSAYNSGNARIVRQWGSSLLSTSGFWSSHNGTAQVMGVSLFGQEGSQTFDLQTSIELPNLALANSYMTDTTNAKTIAFAKDYTVVSGGVTPTPPTTYTLTVSPSVLGGGSAVDVTPGGSGTYASGTNVSVLATANAGYSFDGWMLGGAVVSTSLQYDFQITSNTHLVAVFTQLNPPIRVDVSVVVERKSNSNSAMYRVTLGAMGPKAAIRDKKEYTATYLNVIGGGETTPISYIVVVEFSTGGSWQEIHRSTLLVYDEDVEHKIFHNN